MNGHNSTKFCIHIIFDKSYVGIAKRHFFANLQQSYNPSLNSEFGQPWTAEFAALDQLKKSLNLLENYLKIIACSQVIDRCPLGYLLNIPDEVPVSKD